ncbi:MAG: hypothetical protein IPH06_01745 [Alphaproteobacteria bacterium]|nr:hypothetical protein [Alphaproteobacteria bacterium]QQS56777.1 MAG: hypothetical protein IPN28_11000 [Alphaproteobacteria bacterium]
MPRLLLVFFCLFSVPVYAGTVEGYRTITLSGAGAERINLQGESAVITLSDFSGYALILNGGHVVFTGTAQSDKPALEDGGKRAILRIKNAEAITGRDAVIDAGGGHGLDALIVGNDDGRLPVVTLERVKLIGGWNNWPYEKGEFHGDALQDYMGVKSFDISDSVIVANNTGFFADPQHPVERITLTNVRFEYGVKSSGYALYLKNTNAKSDYVPEIVLENVSVRERHECIFGRECPAEMYSVHPPQQHPKGAVRRGDEVCWPEIPEIKGCVRVVGGS